MIYIQEYCPRYPDVDKRPGFDHGYTGEGKMTFDQGEQLCRDKGVTMPVMERFPYAEDIAEFLGTRVNGNQGETSIWLGNRIQA